MKHRWKLFSNLVRNDHFRNLFAKYFFGAALAVMIIVVAYAVISYRMYSMYLQSAVKRYHETNLYKTSDLVDYVFEGIEQNFHLVTSDEHIRELIEMPKEALPGINRTLPSQAIDMLFYRTVLTPALDSIYVYGLRNGVVVTWTDFRSIETFSDGGFMDAYRDGQRIFARKKGAAKGAADLITIVREIERDGEIQALVAFNLKYEMFAHYVDQGFEHAPENVCVAGLDGHIFCAGDAALLNTNMQLSGELSAPFLGAMETGSAYSYADDHVISAVLSPQRGYVVVSSIRGREISDFRENFVRLIAFGAAIGLLAAFVVAIIISYRLYGNVLRLVSYTGAVTGGETAYITENVASLLARNKHIEHELAQRLVELKKAQAIALQNQINPHFILNTLQMVNLDLMGLAQGETVATRVIALLSDILQSNLHTTDHIVTLSYEIRQAIKYIEIENIRNMGKFHVEWEVDESLLACKTVKFIIQPILENAIKHGLMNSGRDEKHIRIHILAKDRRLECIVTDNGLGMSGETLATMRDRLALSHIPENSHIGLCNVDKRIKLVFGEGYGVTLESSPGEGARVTVSQKLLRRSR